MSGKSIMISSLSYITVDHVIHNIRLPNLTIVVRAKPANSPPTSLIPTNGDILEDIPHIQTTSAIYKTYHCHAYLVLPSSASCKEHFSSYSDILSGFNIYLVLWTPADSMTSLDHVILYLFESSQQQNYMKSL